MVHGTGTWNIQKLKSGEKGDLFPFALPLSRLWGSLLASFMGFPHCLRSHTRTPFKKNPLHLSLHPRPFIPLSLFVTKKRLAIKSTSLVLRSSSLALSSQNRRPKYGGVIVRACRNCDAERPDLLACQGRHCCGRQSESTYLAKLKLLPFHRLICITPMEELGKCLMRHKMMINEFIGLVLIE